MSELLACSGSTTVELVDAALYVVRFVSELDQFVRRRDLVLAGHA